MSEHKTSINRTLEVVRQLAMGKQLDIPELGVIGMGEDMAIGFILVNQGTGKETIAAISTMDLAQLNRLLDKYEIEIISK